MPSTSSLYENRQNLKSFTKNLLSKIIKLNYKSLGYWLTFWISFLTLTLALSGFGHKGRGLPGDAYSEGFTRLIRISFGGIELDQRERESLFRPHPLLELSKEESIIEKKRYKFNLKEKKESFRKNKNPDSVLFDNDIINHNLKNDQKSLDSNSYDDDYLKELGKDEEDVTTTVRSDQKNNKVRGKFRNDHLGTFKDNDREDYNDQEADLNDENSKSVNEFEKLNSEEDEEGNFAKNRFINQPSALKDEEDIEEDED